MALLPPTSHLQRHLVIQFIPVCTLPSRAYRFFIASKSYAS